MRGRSRYIYSDRGFWCWPSCGMEQCDKLWYLWLYERIYGANRSRFQQLPSDGVRWWCLWKWCSSEQRIHPFGYLRYQWIQHDHARVWVWILRVQWRRDLYRRGMGRCRLATGSAIRSRYGPDSGDRGRKCLCERRLPGTLDVWR